MDKTDVINVINEQIEEVFAKPLSLNSVDLLYKLTTIRANLLNGSYRANNGSQTVYSNGKYDRNINELLDSYILARKNGNTADIITSLEILLAELSDLVVEIYNTARCGKERELITDSIRKMERH